MSLGLVVVLVGEELEGMNIYDLDLFLFWCLVGTVCTVSMYVHTYSTFLYEWDRKEGRKNIPAKV